MINDFICALQANQISLLVDVRSQPYSQHFPDYNKDSLAKTLGLSGIYYRNYAKEFGARQEDRKYYSKEGFLDFELFAKSPLFLGGYEKLVSSMKQKYHFALMCAEKDPFNCHRAILVSRAFHDAGYNVIHLLPNNKKTTQEEIESRLLDKYFPNRDQLTLFGDSLDEGNYLLQAYRNRNAEIGYSIEEEGK
ncbi:MAG: DUF488 domain-containing protein [Oscillospiraceae bacterium]|nr:DUF488 domain-containing protein [Oscillospiraceae bacterium]